MVFYKAERNGIDKPDGQPFGKAVHVIEPVVAVHGGDSRDACLPCCSQREYVGFCAVRVYYVIISFSDDFLYLADVTEYIGRFDHCDIDAQCFRIVSEYTGAEADELHFHMTRQFPEQIEHVRFCSAYIAAAYYVDNPHTDLHGPTAAFLRQSVLDP